jgi:hypothetical protein
MEEADGPLLASYRFEEVLLSGQEHRYRTGSGTILQAARSRVLDPTRSFDVMNPLYSSVSTSPWVLLSL